MVRSSSTLSRLRSRTVCAVLCIALSMLAARADDPVEVSNAEELVAAVESRAKLIMVVQHLNMAGQSLGELKGFDSMAIWGNCTVPLPQEAAALNVPPTYFKPNMCAMYVDQQVPLYQSTGLLWLSNLAIFATLGDKLVNLAVLTANSTFYMVDSVVANCVFSGVRGIDSRLVIVGSAFQDNGAGYPANSYSPNTDIQALSLANPNTDVAVITDSYLTTVALVAGVDPDIGVPLNPAQTQTMVLARDTIEGSAGLGQCVGLCVNYNATGQPMRPSVYTDLPSSKYGFNGDPQRTAEPLSAVTWEMVQPSSEEAAWLASLNEAGVAGAVHESFDPLGLGPLPPPPPDAATTDSTSTSSTRSVTGPPTSTTPSKKKSNVGPIVGGIVGGVAGLLLLTVLIMYAARRKRSTSRSNVAYAPTTDANHAYVNGIPPQPEPTTTPGAPEAYPPPGAYAVAASPSGHPLAAQYGSWGPRSGEALPYAGPDGAYSMYAQQPHSLPGSLPPQPSSFQGSLPPGSGTHSDSAYTIASQLAPPPPLSKASSSQNNTLSSMDTKTQQSLGVASGALLEGGTATNASAPRSRGDKAADVDVLQQQLESLFKSNKPLLGRYRILPGASERRVGGQGVVQFCAHMHDPNRKYAVKFFLDRVAFDAEQRLYENPNLRGVMPPVDDVVGNEDGHLTSLGRPLPPMVVLEKGEALDEWARRCQPDFPSCVQIIMHLVKRIADLHAKGFTHRDLKPSNCLFLFSNNAWTICDFGCCVPIGQMAPLSYTLAYAAPETVQASIRGERHVIADPAVDVWALGVMAYELLTRTRVFPAGSNTTVHRIMQGEEPLRWEDLAAPSRAAELRQLGFMKDGIMAMLQRDPAARTSLAEVHRRWKAVLGQETTMAFA